jgi:large subunit ribosomal protein L24
MEGGLKDSAVCALISLQEKMKKKFSKAWKSGTGSVRKKRKFLANAPLHMRHKIISSNLSEDLRKKYKKRSLPLRKGDEVKIMRGKFKGKTGKVKEIDLKSMKVAVDKIQNQKKDGTKIDVYFDSSKLQIQEINLDDKMRIKDKNFTREESAKKENAPQKK